MRKSPWSLLALAASILALAYVALSLSAAQNGAGQRGSVWNLLLDWTPQRENLETGHKLEGTEDARLTQNKQSNVLQMVLLVEDQAGNPLAGVEIQCDRITASSIGRVAEGKTKDDGHFVSARLEPGQYEVQARKYGFLEAPNLTIELPPIAGQKQRIRLEAGCVVAGKINGTDGIPRNHGVLLLEDPDHGVTFHAQPDDHGNFHFPAVGSGKWHLSWRTHNRAPAATGLSRDLVCAAGKPQEFLVTLAAFDPRVPDDPDTLGIGIHDAIIE